MVYQSLLIAILLNLFSCNSTIKAKNEGVVELITNFYDPNGKVSFNDTLVTWFQDSITIQKVNRINIVTDTANNSKVTHSVIAFRYINLKSRVWLDYKTFSATAKPFNMGLLPDTMFMDYGWSFYSKKNFPIDGIPQKLSDTTIDGINFKRAKFHLVHQDPNSTFMIGLFRCDGKAQMFSLEKAYSDSINCTLSKYYNFKIGNELPYGSKEVKIVSEKLNEQELKVFKSWYKNIINKN